MTEPSKWQPTTVALTYRLGEIPLFSVRFTGLANREHFTLVAPYADVPGPDDSLDGSAATCLLYPTYPIVVAPPAIVSRGPWLLYTPYTFTNFYVDFKRFGTFEDYLKTFSAKSRSTLQRKVKKFAEAEGGDVKWREFSRADEMDEFMSLAGAVSATTYQERLLGSGLPTSTEFVLDAKEHAARGGAFGYVLFFHTKPVAYIFCFCTDGIVTYDYVGYDPEVASLSAGTVLQYLALRSLFEKSEIRIFDFTEGEGAHKSFFATDRSLCAKTFCFRRTLGTVLLVHLHYRLNQAVEAVGRLLDRHGLKARVRKWIRAAS